MEDKSDFKINSRFAQNYEKYRQKEEFQRLKDRYGDVGDSGSESSESASDDGEVVVNPKLDRDFYRTLSLLKKKDPKIYEQDAKFYSDEDDSDTEEQQPSSKPAVKPMYLKDYERKVILEKGGKYEDDEDSEEDEEEAAKRRERAASPSYIQEQKELKESFRKFIHDSDDEEKEKEKEEGGGGGEKVVQTDGLLTRRVRTAEEKDKDEEDYVEWLKGQTDVEGAEELQDMRYLREFWSDPQLDEKERFLKDFVLNKRYLEDEEKEGDRIPSYEDVVQEEVEDSEEEGESFLQRQEDFERSYNFRFEEPDSLEIKTYPRSIATSVRTKDDRRKLKREDVKDRKQREKEQKQEQLKQLKNLKRAEIMQKLQKLQELTGNQQLAFSQADLDGDFDPGQHDALMQNFFGDEYYGDEEGEKPQFEEEDELEEHWNWDTWKGAGGGVDQEGEGCYSGGYEAQDPNCEDPDFIMDADYDPSQPSTSKKQQRKEKKKMRKEDVPMGKKKRKSHFLDVISQDKPVFDPKERSFEQYLDEFYKLDYEDIIDDLPCRFRYRQVLANDFGLSTDEILKAEEKDLNRWCSLKKTCMFRSDHEEKCDLQNYRIKAQNTKRKQEILPSVYNEEEQEPKGRKRRRVKSAEKNAADPSGATDAAGALGEPGALREPSAQEEDEGELLTQKNKTLEPEVPQEEKEEEGGAPAAGSVAAAPEDQRKGVKTLRRPLQRQRRLGKRGAAAGPLRVRVGSQLFSGQRLKAYGLNPKRLHGRQVFQQAQRSQERRRRKKTPKD
ncbi:protein KRI1 homolog [Gadus morhua]|uniref:Protein KRI1 homolog n=1 Tax=Gadus morhua TaxID=8049 RepID=A0A8C4YY50_GADMO|nr:protein KRI1 homolog [Gadus morhua]